MELQFRKENYCEKTLLVELKSLIIDVWERLEKF